LPNTIWDHIEVVQAIINLLTGAIGVGIGLGFLRGTINQIKRDLAEVIENQKKLRTGAEGGFPIYMTRPSCDSIRKACEQDREKQTEKIIEKICEHTGNIKAIENYVRWEMQDRGLTIEQINKILSK
jgi:hypothetical protein